MKILGADQITAVVASGENTNYPKENVQDNIRTNPWKAAAAVESTLTLTISANSNALFLAYMNSATVTVEVKDATTATIYGPTAHTLDSRFPNLWVDYTLESGVATAIITFSDPGAVAPYCGIARAGYAYDFKNPEYGLNEGLKDLSISKDYKSGAIYYKQKSILRTFSGIIDVERDNDFYTFLYTLILASGRGPYAWYVTDLNGTKWPVFAWLDNMPSGSHSSYTHSTIPFSLTEGL